MSKILSLAQRNKIVKLHVRNRVSISDLALRYHVHRTTIAHIVTREREKGGGEPKTRGLSDG
jgi:transposase